MHLFQKLLYTAGSLLVGTAVSAQRATPPAELREFSEQRIRHQKTLGLALGGYALANIAVGSLAAGQTSGETKYFHQMNVYWNLFNLGIAGAGLLGSRKKRAEDETLGEAIRQHQNMKQVLLFNAGLDVAYIVGGAYLRERATSRPDKADQLRGYGKSVMLQGGFLLAFDAVNYLIFKNRGDKQQLRLVSAGPMGIGLAVSIK
ncbi:DUF6992 family protein [Spirosoma utsteinense]|uniref:DUF4134 domain-containing protein n=1 Tax=Spirosoma utsteinense TaxID=2585773 RepID=A0ABR6W274_9BACT|nr:hypothetical protein [Spirosoma utsteinense]MBC3785242.1 hypothetical protein [Spirosoma utsteinense]MBC3790532.1 hypothetical protein [Spirosoma utsteinense]